MTLSTMFIRVADVVGSIVKEPLLARRLLPTVRIDARVECARGCVVSDKGIRSNFDIRIKNVSSGCEMIWIQ